VLLLLFKEEEEERALGISRDAKSLRVDQDSELIAL